MRRSRAASRDFGRKAEAARGMPWDIIPPSPVHLAVIPKRSVRALAAAALLALAPCALGADGRAPAGEPRAATPEERRAEALGYVFGRVEIAPGDIFDPERPGEDNRLFRFAHRPHRTTRPQ